VFPAARYRQVKLVSAPPYGTTHVFEKIGSLDTDVEPALAINDGTGRQWSVRATGALPLIFTAAAPVVADIHHYAINAHRAATMSVAATLDQAFYAIDVELDRSSDAQTGFILASTSGQFRWERGALELPVTPYLVGQRRVTVLVDHFGGSLFLSRFEKPGGAASTFRVVRVRRIVPLADHNELASVPDVRTWTPSQPAVHMRDERGVVAAFDGVPQGGVQIASPWIAVTPGARMALTVPVESPAPVTAGIIGADGQWLAPPVGVPGRLTFDTNTSTRIAVSLYATRDFRLTAPLTLSTVAPRQLYVDRVMGCRSPYIQLPDLPCMHRR
jgi:hypothetical protein